MASDEMKELMSLPLAKLNEMVATVEKRQGQAKVALERHGMRLVKLIEARERVAANMREELKKAEG